MLYPGIEKRLALYNVNGKNAKAPYADQMALKIFTKAFEMGSKNGNAKET